MNACTIHGIIAEPVCRRCFPNGITPAERVAGIILKALLLVFFVGLPSFLALGNESDIAAFIEVAGAVLMIILAPVVIGGGGLFLCVCLRARNVRMK